jgi:hypothetical protein
MLLVARSRSCFCTLLLNRTAICTLEKAYARAFEIPKLSNMRPRGKKKIAQSLIVCVWGDRSPNPTVVRVVAIKYLCGEEHRGGSR